MEVQRGVVGDLSTIPELANAARAVGLIDSVAKLLKGARLAGLPVVHCTAGFLPDRSGTPRNAPLITALLRRPGHLTEGTPAVEIVHELGPEPGDHVSARRHGVSPFGGTSLDSKLKELGVSTVIATGVSLNLGIPGLAIEAVNLGYSVVLPRDAVCGVPADYAAAVLTNTMSLIATITSVEELLRLWS
jgi:nicotinamidase-related amidase